MAESKKMKISLPSMVLFAVCSIMVLYTLSLSASFGLSGIGAWFVVILLFFIPNGLICAELGSTWVSDGGIYLFAKRAFGEFIASQVSWLYWVNVVFFLPAVCVTFAGNLNSFFFPNMSTYVQMAIVIGLIWFTVILGIVNLSYTQKISQYGGIVIVALMAIMFTLGILYGFKNGFANNFSLSSFKPTFSGVMQFGPLIVFNLLGFELLSSIATKMDNPSKNVPKFILISGFLVAIFYILGSLSILSVIPVAEINTVTAITDSFSMLTTGVLGKNFAFLGTIMTLAVLYCLLASAIAWLMGANHVMVATGLDQKSKILGHVHPKYGTPDYAYYIVGIFGTIYTILNYLGGSGVQSIFWVIFAFSSIMYMIPYLVMFLSVIKLRYVESEIDRPYKIPGGKAGVWICGILAEIGMIITIVSFSFPPEGTENVFMYELTMWGGLIATMAIGVFLTISANKKKKKLELKDAA